MPHGHKSKVEAPIRRNDCVLSPVVLQFVIAGVVPGLFDEVKKFLPA
jgi:hypothetical protein